MYSAGILPYCNEFVLIGREERGWSGFSGKCESGETPKETAVREFNEETAHIFKGVKISKNTICISTSTPKKYKFYLYLVKFDNYDTELNSIFLKSRVSTTNPAEKEKTELKWVHLDDIGSLDLSQAFRKDLKDIKEKIKTHIDLNVHPQVDDNKCDKI